MTSDTSRHIIIGTAGHVDHGKTALIKALTGADTDRLKEEKARGISIDLGFAPFASREEWSPGSSMFPVTSASSATCWPASAASTWFCWWSMSWKGLCLRPMSTCRSCNC